MVEKRTSKELLAESLSELLKTQPFDKITVTAIAVKCGVGKRTFYNYFKDKYELALWCYTHQLDRYFEENPNAVTFYGFMAHTVETLCDNRSFGLSLLRYTGQNNVRHAIYEPEVERYLSIIEQVYGEDITPEIRDAVGFFVGGTITYAEHRLPMPELPLPEKIVPLFEACVPPILRKYLNDPEQR